MTIRNYDIGGMLARSGQSIGQRISQGVENFGEGIGGLITGVGTGVVENIDRRAKEKTAQEVQQLLQQNANNPAQLNALGQKYASEGNNDMAKLFFDAAQTAIEKIDAGKAQGLQEGLSVITRAAQRGVPYEQLKTASSFVIRAGGTQAQVLEAYEAGKNFGKKDDLIKGTPGTVFFERGPNGEMREVASVPFKDKDEGTDRAFKLALTGKYDPQSIQDAIDSDGNIDYGKLEAIEEKPDRGNISSAVEKINGNISKESTKAAVGLSRNRALQGRLIAEPDKSTGIISDWRTSVLNIAGLRDAEEEDKTAFLRTRNTDIINSLPPGVASDTDVRIFSQGFPADNASSEEILSYLQAEERILAASSDMALVADRHLASQINNGLDGTMVGFEDKKQQYGVVMQRALADMEEQKANAKTEAEAIDIEQRIIRQVTEVLGFTPKFYR